MELFNEAPKTYKTRENAVKALAKVVDLDDVRWFILATPDGRFAPCVHYSGREHGRAGSFVCDLPSKGICVVG